LEPNPLRHAEDRSIMPDRSIEALEASVGTQHTTVTDFTVEAGKVSEFARAVGDTHAVFHDAVDTPWPAPLGFTRVSYFPRYRPPGVGDWFGFDLGFDQEHVLHGEQAYQFQRPVVVGDTLSAKTTLTDVYQRERRDTAPMTFCVFETEYTDETDELVLTSRTTRIEVPPADTTSPTDGKESSTSQQSPPDRTGPEGRTPARTRQVGPLTRQDFVRYAGASGDFNPVHYDEPYAVEHGHPGVFGQGMLTAGYASALLTDWVGPKSVESFVTRFESRVWPGDTLTVCGADRTGSEHAASRELSLWVLNQGGERVLSGSATIASDA
jgi:acyl dehydratase